MKGKKLKRLGMADKISPRMRKGVLPSAGSGSTLRAGESSIDFSGAAMVMKGIGKKLDAAEVKIFSGSRLSEMDSNQVERWLRRNGLEKLARSFRRHKIRGDDLHHLTPELLNMMKCPREPRLWLDLLKVVQADSTETHNGPALRAAQASATNQSPVEHHETEKGIERRSSKLQRYSSNRAHSDTRSDGKYIEYQHVKKSKDFGNKSEEGRRREEASSLCRIILPDNKYIRMWDLAILTMIMFSVFTVPFRLVFARHSDEPQGTFVGVMGPWLALEFILGAIFIVDMVFSSHRAFYDDTVEENDSLITDAATVRSQYLQSWGFAADLFACIPTAAVTAVIATGDYSDELRWLSTIKLLRVFRLGRIHDVEESMKSIAPRFTYLNLVSTFVVILLTWHYVACGYWAIARWQGFCQQENIDECSSSWAPWIGFLHQDVFSQWLQSIFFAVMVTTSVGRDIHPQTNPETIYTIVCAIIGLLLQAMIVFDVLPYAIKRRQVYSWMTHRRLPKHFKQKILEFYEYTWMCGQEKSQKIIKGLPDALQKRMDTLLYEDLIKRTPIFQECQDKEFLKLVASKLKVRIYMKGDFIFREEAEGVEMFIIRRGEVSIQSKLHGIIKRLSDGDCFGEMALFSRKDGKLINEDDHEQRKRNASARSVRHSELLSISHRVLDDIFSNNEELEEQFASHIKELVRIRAEENREMRNFAPNGSRLKIKGAKNISRKLRPNSEIIATQNVEITVNPAVTSNEGASVRGECDNITTHRGQAEKPSLDSEHVRVAIRLAQIVEGAAREVNISIAESFGHFKSSAITPEEFRFGLRSLGIECSQTAAQALIRDFGNGNDFLDFGGFERVVASFTQDQHVHQ